MQKFVVHIPENHIQHVEIEAENEKQAIELVAGGDGELLELEYLSTEEDTHNWKVFPAKELQDGLTKRNPKHEPVVALPEIVGKTIESIRWSQVEGSNGKEPCVMLRFTDGTSHGFVLPIGDD